MLEVILKGGNLTLELSLVLSEWLRDVCNLSVATDVNSMLEGNGIDVGSLIDYALAVRPLLKRCLPKYELEDKIRTKAGGILADPLNYPSAQFSHEYTALGLWSLKSSLDVSAQRQHPDFSLNNISISAVVTKSFNYALAFTYPIDFQQTIAVEFSLNNPSKFPSIELLPGLPWNGFIDWIYRDKDGGINLIDHKTNKLLSNELEVVHHDQLNIYAALYYEIFNEWPTTIGIQHLPSNTLVKVPVDPIIAASIYSYYRSIALEIITPRATWLKRSPAKQYDGTCAKKMGQTLQLCPALSKCWPHFNPGAISLN